ncbi:hypothetical protein MXD59_25000 [Frankia sp. Ag45/Mut15]|uniref:Uncharacterized protein n=1 Tax=Frankia umida TaxID=573489 RepID=A0ABT0K5J0_9ACTN|nr:hypothetical protein [Frankia umida]MCK9878977.1 hypothetical protein [Frankia umida]
MILQLLILLAILVGLGVLAAWLWYLPSDLAPGRSLDDPAGHDATTSGAGAPTAARTAATTGPQDADPTRRAGSPETGGGTGEPPTRPPPAPLGHRARHPQRIPAAGPRTSPRRADPRDERPR